MVLSLVDEKRDAQSGFLRTLDLYLLKIKPQTVVLSTCQTRGFLANNTPRIVAALWKVDDAATAELMTRFYRAMLKENRTPAAALRTAQNELRQIPRFSHPRYWGGFYFDGRMALNNMKTIQHRR